MILPFALGSPEHELIHPVDSSTVRLKDHLFGFDLNFENYLLRAFDDLKQSITIYTEYIFEDQVKSQYPNLNIKFDAAEMIRGNNLLAVERYAKNQSTSNHTKINFISSFNKTMHPGRIWLVLWLYELGWFNENFCSKHFEIMNTPRGEWLWSPIPDEVVYLYSKYVGDDYNLPAKQNSRNQFLKKIIKFGDQHHSPYDDLKILETFNHRSFVNLVSETAPTNSIPFPTEKSLCPIVQKTLWLAYAPMGHHKFMSEKFGFRLHQSFDYAFDQEPNPVERLGKLTHMLTKFSSMTIDQWQDVYAKEKETLEFNFEHVANGSFLKRLQQLDETNSLNRQ